MTAHDEFREWDAAYLLGSLSAVERREFERHLAGCAACASAVAELAGIPGMLAQVPAAEAEKSLAQPLPPAPDLLPRLVSSAAGHRRRTRLLMGGVTVAALAGSLILGLFAPDLLSPVAEPRPVAVAMQLTPVADSPLTASIRLTAEEWGTRVDMECRYRDDGGYATSADYALYLTDAEGGESTVVSWTAAPGSTATPSGTTSLAVADIRSVEVRAVGSGETLLRGSP